jgi:histidine triad (HIT) family protein
MDDCIFCKIVKGDIPSMKVAESENFLAFLDIKPIKKGHVIVIPKKHFRWVWDVENIEEYFSFCQRVVNAQRKAFDTQQVISVIMGDEVPHAHVWLVPQVVQGGRGSFDLKSHIEVSKEEMKEIAKKIKDNFQ